VVGFTRMFRLIRIVVRGRLASKTASQKVGMMMTGPEQEDWSVLSSLLEVGEISPVIDRRYVFSPLGESSGSVT
jgi:hypothetical protein